MLSTPPATEAPCFIPARAPGSGWPWYLDSTVFGESYNSSRDINGLAEWEEALSPTEEAMVELAPPGGWLTVAAFHVVWSENCVKLMPRIAELAPMFPAVSFLAVNADSAEMGGLSKELGVDDFPTIVIYRGGKEVRFFCISLSGGSWRISQTLVVAGTEHAHCRAGQSGQALDARAV